MTAREPADSFVGSTKLMELSRYAGRRESATVRVSRSDQSGSAAGQIRREWRLVER